MDTHAESLPDRASSWAVSQGDGVADQYTVTCLLLVGARDMVYAHHSTNASRIPGFLN